MPQTPMHSYLRSNWVRAGLALLIVGTGPPLFIIAAAAAGLWPDANPNPVGPGLLCAHLLARAHLPGGGSRARAARPAAALAPPTFPHLTSCGLLHRAALHTVPGCLRI